MFCAQYGNHNSYYGNIQLARFAFPIHPYGAWPYLEPDDSPMLNNSPIVEAVEIKHVPDTSIAENIAVIKRLRTELLQTEDTQKRTLLRDQIDKARLDKVKAFQRAARIDEEETLFMLLH